MEPVLDAKGLGSFLRPLCAGGDLHQGSPAGFLRTPSWSAARGRGPAAAALLPPIYLFHGDADKTVPASSTSAFARALSAAGVEDVTVDVRPGISHSDPIIEGPMRGKEYQAELVLQLLLGARGGRKLAALPAVWNLIPRREHKQADITRASTIDNSNKRNTTLAPRTSRPTCSGCPRLADKS